MTKTSVNTGNFTVVVSGDIKAGKLEEVQSNGVLYDLQRGGLTAAYQSLGGVKGDNGKVKLPKDFKRDAVEYTDDNALTMQEEVEAWAKEVFDDGVEVSVAKYEGSETASPMKRATALVDSFLGEETETVWRGILGVPTGDRDALIAKANTMGLGIQPPKAAKA